MIKTGPFGRLETLLYRLWKTYLEECRFANNFLDLYGKVTNDHIAFRTVQTGYRCDNSSGIWPIVEIFHNLGYTKVGEIEFPSKNLYAIYMEYNEYNNDSYLPKIFISQFETEKLNESEDIIFVNDIFNKESRIHIPNANHASIDTLYNFFRVNIRPLLREHEIEQLNLISQYLPWVALFGNRVNHFTAKVSDIEKVVSRCIKAGIPMKEEIEGKPGSAIRQTATKPSMAMVEVLDDVRGTIKNIEWPYAYYEIAERGKIEFNGFLGEQATNLFDMTKKIK